MQVMHGIGDFRGGVIVIGWARCSLTVSEGSATEGSRRSRGVPRRKTNRFHI